MKQLVLVPVVALTWLIVLALVLAAGAAALIARVGRPGTRRAGRHYEGAEQSRWTLPAQER